MLTTALPPTIRMTRPASSSARPEMTSLPTTGPKTGVNCPIADGLVPQVLLPRIVAINNASNVRAMAPRLLPCVESACGRALRPHARFLRAEQFHADALREIEFAVEARRRAVPEIVNLGGSPVAVQQVGRAALGKRGLRHPGDRRDSERRRQQESLHHGIPPAEPGAYPCGPSALPAPNSFRRRQPGTFFTSLGGAP